MSLIRPCEMHTDVGKLSEVRIALHLEDASKRFFECGQADGWNQAIGAAADRVLVPTIGDDEVGDKSATAFVPEEPDAIFHVHPFAIRDGVFQRREYDKRPFIRGRSKDHRC